MNIFKSFKSTHEMMTQGLPGDGEILAQHREARKHQTDEFQVINRQEIEKLASQTGTIAVTNAHIAHEEALRKTGSFPVIRRAA